MMAVSLLCTLDEIARVEEVFIVRKALRPREALFAVAPFVFANHLLEWKAVNIKLATRKSIKELRQLLPTIDFLPLRFIGRPHN